MKLSFIFKGNIYKLIILYYFLTFKENIYKLITLYYFLTCTFIKFMFTITNKCLFLH